MLEMGTTTSTGITIGGDFIVEGATITTTANGVATDTTRNITFTIGSAVRDNTINFTSATFPLAVAGNIVAYSSTFPGLNLPMRFQYLIHSTSSGVNLIQNSLDIRYNLSTATAGTDYQGNSVVWKSGGTLRGTFSFSGQGINSPVPVLMMYDSSTNATLPMGGGIAGSVSIDPFEVIVDSAVKGKVSSLSIKYSNSYSTTEAIVLTPKDGYWYLGNLPVYGTVSPTNNTVNGTLEIQLQMGIQISAVSAGLESVKIVFPNIRSTRSPATLRYTEPNGTFTTRSVNIKSNTLTFKPLPPFTQG